MTAAEPRVIRQRLTLRLTAREVAHAEALLELAGAEAISLADAGEDPVLEPAPATTPLWPTVLLSALLPGDSDLRPLRALLIERCAAEIVATEIVQAAEWQQALRQVFSARAIGRRLWLAPADDDVVPAERIGIRLHMGLAFGTGEHPTTALCLDWIDEHIERDSTILDYGCGSGVLALAALGLGAARGWAVDNDPQALEATRANALLNGFTERLVVGALDSLPPLGVDVLAANILAGTLIELVQVMARCVKPGGSAIFSGILERQAEDVIAVYAPFFEHFERRSLGGWVLLAAKKRDTDGNTRRKR